MIMAVIISFDANRRHSTEKRKKNEKRTMDILDILEYEEAINPILRTKCVQDYNRKDLRYLHKLMVRKYKMGEEEYQKIVQLMEDMKTGSFSARLKIKK